MKLNLHNKDSLSRIIVYLFSGSTLTYLIIFITSVIIFRSVDKGDYGLYVILMSVFSILELFMGGYSQSIARYLKEAIPICKKQQIILYSFYYKYFLIAIFLIILFFAKENHFFKYLINDYDLIKDNIDKFLFVAIVGSVISVMSGISNAILTSLYQYRFITTSSIIRDFTYLLSVIGLTFYTKNYLVYLYVGLLLNIILLVVLASTRYLISCSTSLMCQFIKNTYTLTLHHLRQYHC